MYLTYDEYQTYGGTLDETSFTDLEIEAESTINWFTFNRLLKPEWASVLENEYLKRCMYQLIKLEELEASILGIGGVSLSAGKTVEAGIVKESNDGVTTEYNVPSSSELLAFAHNDKTKKDMVHKYLGPVVNELGRKILYRGVYPGE